MATIPTVPSFVTGETPSIAKLNQLASCVSFVSVLPAWCSMTASQSVVTATRTALTWTEGTDRDGGHSNSVNPTEYIAQTPGYYLLSASIDFASSASGDRNAWFQVTTGSGNPGGSGNVTAFGASGLAAATAARTTVSIAAMSPYLYVGDFLIVNCYQSSGSSLTVTGTWQLALAGLGP